MSEPRWLDERENRAWRGYFQLALLLNLQISRDLAADSGLSFADYQVLVALSEEPERSKRAIELAEAMRWSKSKLSHQLDRMAARDLVRREELPGTGRAVLVVLTPTGLSTIQRAAPSHIASVRRNFIDLLTPEQLEAFATAAETVVTHLSDGSQASAPDG